MAERPRRLGVVTDTFDLGGQERGCLDLLVGLDRDRFEPRLYAFRPGALLGSVESAGVPVLVGHHKPADDRSWTAADRDARARWRTELPAALRRDGIDVCVVWGWGDGVEAAVDAGVTGIVERVDGPSLAGRVRDKSACSAVICESPTIRRLLVAQAGVLHCDPASIVVIANGIDRARFDPGRHPRAEARRVLGIPDGTFVIATLARLAPEKALDVLVEAVAFLAGDTRTPGAAPTTLLLAGPDGGCRASLEALVEARGLGRVVRMLGPRDDVPEILAAADAFALTSLYEGMPLALLEAMSMGLPVVATHVGAIPEVIDGNGLLVAPLDAWATAEALRRLRDEPGIRRALADRSLELAGKYSLPRMIRRYERVFERAAAGPAGHRA